MEPTIDADDRWAAAAQFAERGPDDARGTRRRRALAVVVAVVAAAVVLGIVLTLVGLLSDSSTPASGDGGAGPLSTQLAVGSVALLIGVPAAVWGIWTGRLVPIWQIPAMPLTRDEKRSLRRQLAGREPVNERRLGFVLAIARNNQSTARASAPVILAWLLLVVAQAFGADSSPLRWLVLIAGCAIVVEVVRLSVVYARTASFIRSNTRVR